MIAEKKDQIATRKKRDSRGGRPPKFDAGACSFAYGRQWRGSATRYDKLAITFRAAVVISAIPIWVRR
ncbi:hypothetical protein EB835_10255 [Brevibacterium sp. S22]|nr:hypothetical protein EB835_10255 [Brevibacterium sp. S22]